MAIFARESAKCEPLLRYDVHTTCIYIVCSVIYVVHSFKVSVPPRPKVRHSRVTPRIDERRVMRDVTRLNLHRHPGKMNPRAMKLAPRWGQTITQTCAVLASATETQACDATPKPHAAAASALQARCRCGVIRGAPAVGAATLRLSLACGAP